MYPAMVPSQYTLDNRYFPYSVPRTADNMQVGSIDYRDVVQENAGLQQVHPREGTPDNRLDGAKTGQKRRANSPPPSSSIPQGSAGVPFSRRPPIGFNGPQIMYQASPIHPQLEGSGYSTGAYPSPASWSIGASVANSSMQSYALPDAASLNSSPYAGLRSGTPIANLPRGSSQPHPIIQQLGRGGESTLGSAANILPLPITPVPPYGASTTLRLGGAYVCECCPKKPKKYESLDQLR